MAQSIVFHVMLLAMITLVTYSEHQLRRELLTTLAMQLVKTRHIKNAITWFMFVLSFVPMVAPFIVNRANLFVSAPLHLHRQS